MNYKQLEQIREVTVVNLKRSLLYTRHKVETMIKVVSKTVFNSWDDNVTLSVTP